MDAYKGVRKTASGKLPISFRKEGTAGIPIQIPCGQCIGCRLERSRQWAIRCVHEATLHEDNCFVTLTYKPELLPADGSLNKKHFQDFMKRLRFHTNKKIRYYHCGEYGSQFQRPHYHALLFGLDFPDKKLWKESEGFKLYTSETLSSIWGFGFVTIAAVTFETAAYTARYILKKQNGDSAADHYQAINQDTGEINFIQPEYTTMSRRPGIAADWLKKWKMDVYPSDEVIMKNKKMRPPKFYDTIFERDDPGAMKAIKRKRVQQAKKHAEDQTHDRLAQREEVAHSRIKNRKYETHGS